MVSGTDESLCSVSYSLEGHSPFSVCLCREIFIKLRHSFLANGDENFHDVPTYLQKFRNSCIVECVPVSLRSDRNVRDVFEKLFPGQILNAEMLIDTSHLDTILEKRRSYIEQFEKISARYQYQLWNYKIQQQNGASVCCGSKSEPSKPLVRLVCEVFYRQHKFVLTSSLLQFQDADRRRLLSRHKRECIGILH